MFRLKMTCFGDFCLEYGENRIRFGDNRSRKSWMLLAYLFCRRNRAVSQRELIDHIWGDEPASENPENALKVLLHRTRNMLEKLWPGAGHDLLRYNTSGYFWNTEIPLDVDAERFETLCMERPGDLDRVVEALQLYRGEFLEKLSSGTWLIPISTHYHNLYMDTLLYALPLLRNEQRYDEAVALCRFAIRMEPYNEALCMHLMEILDAQEDPKGAITAYENLRDRLFHDFGIVPGEQLRKLYRRISRSTKEKYLPAETVLEHLLEIDPGDGALVCDFESFKVLCHAEARDMLRSGNAVHVALLSVSSLGDMPLSKRSLDRTMAQLQDQLRLNLRRGDAIAQCSESQFVILLPRANYENSCVVCRRVIRAFQNAHPRSHCGIHYLIHALSPVFSGGK